MKSSVCVHCGRVTHSPAYADLESQQPDPEFVLRFAGQLYSEIQAKDIPVYGVKNNGSGEPICPTCKFPCMTNSRVLKLAVVGERNAGKSTWLSLLNEHLLGTESFERVKERFTLDNYLRPLRSTQAALLRYERTLNVVGEMEYDQPIAPTTTTFFSQIPLVYDVVLKKAKKADEQTRLKRLMQRLSSMIEETDYTLALYDVAGELVSASINTGAGIDERFFPGQLTHTIVFVDAEKILAKLNGASTGRTRSDVFAVARALHQWRQRISVVIAKADLLVEHTHPPLSTAFVASTVSPMEDNLKIRQQLRNWGIPVDFLPPAEVLFSAVSSTGGASPGTEIPQPRRLFAPLLNAFCALNLIDGSVTV